ncbi:hypothetical protein H7J77_09980 [Mycolicibacillus parakoreensis]|uniref:LppW family protein n=1 Tax=Mycolicibacillus parakoreensis TaxID=1069221 RepID=A0ABY3U0P6_9MYCO|nr:hypothetical protein [Mycolicibacillus parakoreensis]MCV7315867.1 hypothetical protein [Mycolicibacillus parakoreensis]ULN51716.1 hypothetical protein MIU77_12510 [Mycolicibacillus parakoreensis]
MPARPPRPARLATIGFAAVLLGGCATGVAGVPPASPTQPRIHFVTPLATAVAPAPQVPFGLPNPALDGVGERIGEATDAAAARGATITVTVLDRSTGQLLSNGTATTMAIASVAKLFIADDVLHRGPLGAEDRAQLDAMLRSSDDDAAEDFWNRNGGDAITTRVANRYGLTATTPGFDGRWWNTISTAADLVRYYDMLLSGSGGLSLHQANIIVDNLAQSTPAGIDGYPQRFGIPDGLFAEPVAVKQGWMCCVGADWMHLSTGVIGPDRRYVMAIGSLQPGDDATARATITDAVATIFPTGRI